MVLASEAFRIRPCGSWVSPIRTTKSNSEALVSLMMDVSLLLTGLKLIATVRRARVVVNHHSRVWVMNQSHGFAQMLGLWRTFKWNLLEIYRVHRFFDKWVVGLVIRPFQSRVIALFHELE